MKRLLVALMVLWSCGGCASGSLGVGIQIGAPPPPRAFVVPGRPGPDFVWVEGYWYPVRGRWVWHDGYWTRPPFAGAFWVTPYWSGGRFVGGFWDGPRGRMEHNHGWDSSPQRDGGRRR
jgi:hypothetical protein